MTDVSNDSLAQYNLVKQTANQHPEMSSANQFRQSSYLIHHHSQLTPGSPSAILFNKMAPIVGEDNILLPPHQLNEEDRKLWLKSDSNALLYYWYKSPKARQSLKREVERNCCMSAWCLNHNAQCSPIQCIFGLCTPLYLPMMCLMASLCYCCQPRNNTKFHNGSKWTIFSPWWYHDHNEYQEARGVDNTNKFISHGEFNNLMEKAYFTPLKKIGIEDDSARTWLCCPLWTNVCSIWNVYNIDRITHTYLKGRYGKFMPRARQPVPYAQVCHSFQESGTGVNYMTYKQDCCMDPHHPAFQVPPPELLGFDLTFPAYNQPSTPYYGEREKLYPLWGHEQAWLSELDLDQLDYVISIHNQKWGKLKHLDPAYLDLKYIYGEQWDRMVMSQQSNQHPSSQFSSQQSPHSPPQSQGGYQQIP